MSRHLKSWCTGEDSNLRSSKERQIYSLLPLTARPPVPNHSSDEIPPASTQFSPHLNPSSAHAASAHPAPSGNLRHFGACTSVGSPRRTGPALKTSRAGPKLACRFQLRFSASFKWSWRRDLNPRPSDYKSDALPAELRQPKHGSHTHETASPPGNLPGNQ